MNFNEIFEKNVTPDHIKCDEKQSFTFHSDSIFFEIFSYDQGLHFFLN